MENLTKERDLLRQAESRLTREREAIFAEQRNQNLLLTNLKTIQVPHHLYSPQTNRQNLPYFPLRNLSNVFIIVTSRQEAADVL